jgi:hypothetical protein
MRGFSFNRRKSRLPDEALLPGARSRPVNWSSIGLAALVALFVFLDTISFAIFTIGADWAPVWLGGRMSWTDPNLAYDIDLITAAQEPLVGVPGDRPFVYPPSALLLYAPLAALPFSISFLLFGALSLGLFLRAASAFAPRPILLLLAPPVALAVMAGQPTILVMALIVLGLTRLDRDEGWAGLLFAIAAMIKPPLLLLAPVALVAGGYWCALVAAGVGCAAIGAVSLAVFGLDAWLAWLSALPAFNALVTEFEPLLRNAVTPHAMAVRLDLPPFLATAAAALVAVPLAWLGFARTRDLEVRLVTLVGGALLVSPYAMNYELAAFAPVVAAVRFERLRDFVMPVVWAGSLFATWSIAGLVAVYAWGVFRLLADRREAVAATASGHAC